MNRAGAARPARPHRNDDTQSRMSTGPFSRAAGRGRAHRGAQRAALLVALAILPLAARAEWAWSAIPSVTLDGTYETNPDNYSDDSTSPKDDAYIGTVALNVRMEGRTGQGRVVFDPLYRMKESWANDSNRQLDGNELFLPAFWVHSGLRSQTQVSAGYSQYPSRYSDYQVVDPNQPLPPGGLGCEVTVDGRCQVNETQSRWYFGPTWSWSFSPRLRMDLSAQISEVTYDKAEFTGRFDYNYLYGTAGLTRILAPQHRINVELNASQYSADQPASQVENDTTSIGFTVGYEYQYSAQTSFNVSAGSSYSDLKFSGRLTNGGLPCFDPNSEEFVLCETRGDDTNFIGEMYVRREFGDEITGQLGISRELQPNSDGAQVLVDTANLFLDRDLSDRLRLFGGLRYIKQEAVGARSEGILRQRFDREYGRIELGSEYRITDRWSVRGQYSYYLDKQRASVLSGDASSEYEADNNIISLSTRYQFVGIR